ncbi:hypothetical protein FOA43_002228 [Brettanomyces nanus]|uniref:MYND-type domain-containing protein n=1 Tax=Eeniella nana TaxID=13502 RepID=A0A875RZD3_EENNA|nr:uncharacterized protein FOA43_002228 [Brettanomyces nanus]QPG74891.1 hypothetical protein FOA43_002228 [Brettanomyces nanus]
MRDSNNKSVSANKAAVSITSTLYDRRALDCTEDKPLVNSLNHLTFLASSSLKVREALSQDGGLERLIDILYECRNPQTDAEKCVFAWKWVLAFQSLVLVGTRGNEKLRRKVVEAGILPIIATILDNYLITRRMAWVSQFENGYRPDVYDGVPSVTVAGSENVGGVSTASDDSSSFGSHAFDYSNVTAATTTTATGTINTAAAAAMAANSVVPIVSQQSSSVPSDDVVINDEITDSQVNTVFRQVRSLLDQANQTILETEAEIGKHRCPKDECIEKCSKSQCKDLSEVDEKYRKVYKCLEFLKFLHRLNNADGLGLIGQELACEYQNLTADVVFGSQLATNKDISNLLKMDSTWTTELPFMKKFEEKLNQSVPREFENGILIPKEDDVIWSLQLLAFISKYTTLRYEMANTYIVNGLSLRNYSIPPPLESDTGTRSQDVIFDDCDYFEFVEPRPLDNPFLLFPDFSNEYESSKPSPQTVPESVSHALSPEYDKDHADLFKSYYQTLNESEKFMEASKLEKLALDISRFAHREYSKLRMRNRQVYRSQRQSYDKQWDYENSWDELATPAYASACIDNDIRPIKRLNIFPLVEKFTVRHLYSKDINYWSSVIVRNFNRKDENRGGRRQCAYFGCGKWESEPRQFAKCRRCKRAKYCSKECQSKAWAYHKYWCNAVCTGSSADSSSSQPQHATMIGNSNEHHRMHHRHNPMEQGIPPNDTATTLAPGVQVQQQGISDDVSSSSPPNVPNAPTFQHGFFQ